MIRPREGQLSQTHNDIFSAFIGEEDSEDELQSFSLDNPGDDSSDMYQPLDPNAPLLDLFPNLDCVSNDSEGADDNKNNPPYEISMIAKDDPIPGISFKKDCKEIVQVIKNSPSVLSKRKREKEENKSEKKEKKSVTSKYNQQYLCMSKANIYESGGLKVPDYSREEMKKEFFSLSDWLFKIDERFFVLQKEMMKVGLDNLEKNRFSYNMPYDSARFINPFLPNAYYNATRLPGNILLAQSPLDSTLADFWEMAYHADIIVSIPPSRKEDTSAPICPIVQIIINNLIITPIEFAESNYILPSGKVCKMSQFEVSKEEVGVKKIIHIQMPNCENNDLTGYDLASFIDYLNLISKTATVIFHCITGLGDSAVLALGLSLYRKHCELRNKKEVGVLNVSKFVANYRMAYRFSIIETETHYEKLISLIHAFRRIYQKRE